MNKTSRGRLLTQQQESTPHNTSTQHLMVFSHPLSTRTWSKPTDETVVGVVGLASNCSVESLDTRGRTATLVCVVSYTWQAEARQFNVMPFITATLGWDKSSSTAKQNTHPQFNDDQSARLESTTRVDYSSLDDIARHTCTANFTFSRGIVNKSTNICSQ